MFKASQDIGARIVLEAAKFVGLTEVRSNATWDNLATAGKDPIAEELAAEMLRCGWQKGWPYCAAFCEAVWKRAYRGNAAEPLMKQMLTPGCLVSWENAVKQKWTSKEPMLGAIGIMKKGSTTQGHAFIVAGKNGDTLVTIEGNTSPAAGSVEDDRNGDGVYRKTRKLVFKPTTGLHLIGFILPCVYA